MSELVHSEPMFGGIFTIKSFCMSVNDIKITNGYTVELKIDGCDFGSWVSEANVSHAKKILFEKIAEHATGVHLHIAEGYLTSSHMFRDKEQKRQNLAQQLLKHIG